MKTHTKQIVGLSTGVILLLGVLSQPAQAQTILSGTATLADAFGVDTGPEALPVSYLVTLSAGIYTYSYVVGNPVGDVLLNNNGTPTATPEIVDAFSVAFNTLFPNAFISGTQTGGTGDQNNGVNGLFWSFAAVSPGSSSPVLSFESHLAPVMGNANAQDANPPSPWSSFPDGQTVPIPNAVPEPTTTVLFGLSALLLPFRFALKRKAS